MTECLTRKESYNCNSYMALLLGVLYECCKKIFRNFHICKISILRAIIAPLADFWERLPARSSATNLERFAGDVCYTLLLGVREFLDCFCLVLLVMVLPPSFPRKYVLINLAPWRACFITFFALCIIVVSCTANQLAMNRCV